MWLDRKEAFDGTQQFFSIAANDQISTAEAYRSIVVTYRNGARVMLSDVANVIDGLENTKVGGWYQGEVCHHHRHPAPAGRQPSSRRFGAVLAELPRLKRAIPVGVELTVASDRTTTIRASIYDVQFSLALAVILVVMVVVRVPATIRATIIAGVAPAAVADRDLRGDVVLRLRPRQPVAYGAHDRHRLRGRPTPS